MRITIICVGKIKEKYFTGAIEEYSKRLSRYIKLEIIEVMDEKTVDGQSSLLDEQVKMREGERILNVLKGDEYVIALAIKGNKSTSEEFARKIDELATYGKSHIAFIIGGSLGLSNEVLKKADEQISFSDMTFPHQLMRVILLEQVYRAYRIINNEPYHK